MPELLPSELAAARRLHLVACLGLVLPFGNLLVPVLMWSRLGRRSWFVNAHARAAINLQFTYTAAQLVLVVLLTAYFLLTDQGADLLSYWIWGGLLLLANVVLSVRSGVRAGRGGMARYPFAFRVIRDPSV